MRDGRVELGQALRCDVVDADDAHAEGEVAHLGDGHRLDLLPGSDKNNT